MEILKLRAASGTKPDMFWIQRVTTIGADGISAKHESRNHHWYSNNSAVTGKAQKKAKQFKDKPTSIGARFSNNAATFRWLCNWHPHWRSNMAGDLKGNAQRAMRAWNDLTMHVHWKGDMLIAWRAGYFQFIIHGSIPHFGTEMACPSTPSKALEGPTEECTKTRQSGALSVRLFRLAKILKFLLWPNRYA